MLANGQFIKKILLSLNYLLFIPIDSNMAVAKSNKRFMHRAGKKAYLYDEYIVVNTTIQKCYKTRMRC